MECFVFCAAQVFYFEARSTIHITKRTSSTYDSSRSRSRGDPSTGCWKNYRWRAARVSKIHLKTNIVETQHHHEHSPHQHTYIQYHLTHFSLFLIILLLLFFLHYPIIRDSTPSPLDICVSSHRSHRIASECRHTCTINDFSMVFHYNTYAQQKYRKW